MEKGICQKERQGIVSLSKRQDKHWCTCDCHTHTQITHQGTNIKIEKIGRIFGNKMNY